MKRYTDQELENLLLEIESDLAERKEAWKGDAPSAGREAVCAFANDLPDHRRPGVLFIGARDDGTPSGVRVDDQLVRTLSDIRSDGNILPPPSIFVDKRTLNGSEMAVVTVQPSDSPPVRFKGRIFVRVGSRKAIATSQDERILNEKRRYRDIPFDIQPMPSCGLAALSRILFEQDYLPNNRWQVDITSSPETRRTPYPRVALQQLIRNAVLHRTYENTNAPVRVNWFEDRIEIWNPGGPFGAVTESNFGRPGITDYRNPNLADAMRVTGFVQRFGVGIQTARAELAKNGNPDVEFRTEPTAVNAIVRRSP